MHSGNCRFSLGRAAVLVAIFSVWSASLLAKLFWTSSYKRDSFIKEGDSLAWRSGVIPAGRGKILDSNGRTLAWTERFYDLYVEKQNLLKERHRGEEILSNIRRITGRLAEIPDNPGFLKATSISPLQIEALRKIIESSDSVKIAPRLERKTVDYPEIKKLVGTVRRDADGSIVGIEGMELREDSLLRGIPGKYLVMLDRNGKIIPGTIKTETEIRPGKDVRLAESIEELLEKGGDGQP